MPDANTTLTSPPAADYVEFYKRLVRQLADTPGKLKKLYTPPAGSQTNEVMGNISDAGTQAASGIRTLVQKFREMQR